MAALHGSSPLIMHRGEEEAGVGSTAVSSSRRQAMFSFALAHQGEELIAGRDMSPDAKDLSRFLPRTHCCPEGPFELRSPP